MVSGFLTLTQVAKRVGCSRQWVHRLIKDGRLKAEMLGTSSYMIREKDVENCSVRPRAKPANGHGAHKRPQAAKGRRKRA